VLKSFKCAFRGLIHALRTEQSFQIQIVVALVVIILAVYFHIPRVQGLILGVTILMVLSLELVNTIAERIVDLVEPRWHNRVRDIKDVLAAAVLLASLGAIVIGVIVFGPYVFNTLI
jgi:diacylglycerol kinase